MWRWRISLACSRVVPTGTVMRFSLVMRSETGRLVRVSNRRSRFVRMPTSLRPTVTGTPLMRYLAMTSRASATRASGTTVTGSTIIPDSERLTLSTSDAWAAMVMFLWMIPMPPSWAMAMARWASVTVSMAAERMGTLSVMERVRRVWMSTSEGSTLDLWGASSTSSKVSASGIRSSSIQFHPRYQPQRTQRTQREPRERTEARNLAAFGVGRSEPSSWRHDTSCTCGRCRTGRDRCGPPSFLPGAPSGPRRLRPEPP